MNPDKIALRSNSMSLAYNRYVSWGERQGALRADGAVQPHDSNTLAQNFIFYLEPFPGNADWFYIALLAADSDGPRLYYLGATEITNDFSEVGVFPATDRLEGHPGDAGGYAADGKTRYIFYFNEL
jgi:hypothetical protein